MHLQLSAQAEGRCAAVTVFTRCLPVPAIVGAQPNSLVDDGLTVVVWVETRNNSPSAGMGAWVAELAACVSPGF